MKLHFGIALMHYFVCCSKVQGIGNCMLHELRSIQQDFCEGLTITTELTKLMDLVDITMPMLDDLRAGFRHLINRPPPVRDNAHSGSHTATRVSSAENHGSRVVLGRTSGQPPKIRLNSLTLPCPPSIGYTLSLTA